MNIIDLQERLKDLPEQALMQEMQMPTGTAPQFLVLGELKRRKRMRDDYQRMQASDMKTVAEDVITAAGMPQQGIMGLAQGMAPRSAIAQDTGVNDMMQRDAVRAPQPQEMPVQGMYDGGYVRKMQVGGFPDSQSLVGYSQQNFSSILASDPTVRAMAERMGVTVDEYIASLPPETRARSIERLLASREPQGVRTDVFDPAQPALSQVSADLESFLPSTLGRENQELFNLGVNPSFDYSSRMQDQFGIGISDRRPPSPGPMDDSSFVFDATADQPPSVSAEPTIASMTASDVAPDAPLAPLPLTGPYSIPQSALVLAQEEYDRTAPAIVLASEIQGMRAGPITGLPEIEYPQGPPRAAGSGGGGR